MSSVDMAAKSDRASRESKFAWLWTCTLAVLVVCTLALAWFPVLRIGSLPSINYNEGWNAYRDQMAADGKPLFDAPPGLSVTNYPFLSFHVIGTLSKVLGSVTVTGRAVAFAALLAICAMLFGVVRAASGSWRGGLYAGLCFFLWLATFTPERIAMNDPELLGSAIALFGAYAYLRAPTRRSWLAVSAIAAAAAVFTKHDVIALPLAVGLHLLATRNWRGLIVWVVTGVIAAGLLLLATFGLDGPYFFAHLLLPRAYDVRLGFWVSVQYLQRFYAPLVIGCAVLLWCRDVPRRGFVLMLLVIAHAVAFFFAGGDGVGPNIYYEALIAAAAAAAIAICILQRVLPPAPWAGAVVVAALALPALPGVAFVPSQLYADLVGQQGLPALTDAARRSIALLQQARGPAICEDILLCYDAGKPPDYDPYFVKDQVAIRRIEESDTLAMLTAHRYAAVEIGAPEDQTKPGPSERLRFTGAFMRTLLTEYKPVMTSRRYSVFVPRQ